MALTEASPDWLKLPEDVLLLVLKKLPLPDLLRSAAVCPTWCFSAHELRRRNSRPLHQTPWLMVVKSVDSGRFNANFYSLSEQRFYTFSLPHHSLVGEGIRRNLSPQYCPPFNRNVFHGSSHGWMIIADDRSDLYLFNPITGAQVRSLPPVATLGFIEAVYDGQGELSHYYNHGGGPFYQELQVLRRYCYRKVAFSSSPSDGEYTVMVAFSFSKLAFARAGDKEWTVAASDRTYRDIVYHDGDFYLLTDDGAVEVWDLAGNQKASVLVPQQLEDIGHADFEFLVPSSSGDLFLVRSVSVGCTPTKEFQLIASVQRGYPNFKRFNVHKIDVATKELLTGELEKLGNYAFFVASNHSVCLSCKEFPELRPSCIYYDIGTFAAIGIYNMADEGNEYHKLMDDADEYLGWQPLSWIVPSLQ